MIENLIESVSMYFLDVFEEGCGPLQCGGFISVHITEWQQQV